MEAIGWVAIIVILLVIEIITVGLTTIWFVGGGLIALLLNALGCDVIWQIVAFLGVSIVLLIFTRPLAMRYINNKRVKTNYEGIIGKLVRINETVDNMNGTGTAVVNGQEWTVRTEKEGLILKTGSIAKVVNISGVKLIVCEYEENM